MLSSNHKKSKSNVPGRVLNKMFLSPEAERFEKTLQYEYI